MNSYFATDKTISFGDLTGGRMAKHGVGVIIDKTEAGEPFSAKLLYGMSIVLVRADQSGVVTDFQPVQINDEDAPYIGAAIQYEFARSWNRRIEQCEKINCLCSVSMDQPSIASRF